MNRAAMAANPQTPLSGLARALIQQGRVSEADAVSCTEAGGATPNGFLIELDKRGILSALDAASFAAETFGHPLIDISALDPASIQREGVDSRLLAKHQVIPLAKRQNRLI